MKDPVQLSEELGASISGALSTEGEFVNKWIAIAEVISEDGRRWLRTFWPAGSTPWDNMGMLSAALNDANHADWDCCEQDGCDGA